MSAENPDPFDNIVDDVDAKKQARDWAYDALRQGHSPEAVERALRANGWSADDAAEMAEEARKKTRHLRGVVTRDDIAAATEHAYRTRRSSPIMDTYVDGDGATGFGQPVIPAEQTGGGTVLPYSPPPDRRARRRLRAVRIHGILEAVVGGIILLPGLGLVAVGVIGWGAILVVVGGLMLAKGISDARSPTRMIGKLDRGLLDRFHRDSDA